MERCVTELESHPADRALISDIFRAVHTIKGSAGFLGFERLQALAHTGENLLSALRSGQIPVTSDLINALLALHDGLESILHLIDNTGLDGQRSTDQDCALLARLSAFGIESSITQAGEQSTGASGLPGAPVQPKNRTEGPHVSTADEVRHRALHDTSDATVRVETAVLNRLMDLVGELVVTRNGMLQAGSGRQSPELARQLDCITSELRSVVMQARMQPVNHLFGKFPRIVRDLARACDRRARIEFDANGTELDKTLLEAVRDPLTHAIRNAIDHGIEPPEERIRAGKHPEGVVRLNAYGHNGGVVIEISDDGAGIATDRVLNRAIEQGVITAERAAKLSQDETLRLLFEPGFSTAAAVTSISGRGVGLDVVRANIEKIGGHVEIASRPGCGTVLRLHMPLTLAIVPVLIIRSGNQSFAIPQSRLIELIHIGPEDRSHSIERIGSTQLLRTRDQLLPIVSLGQVLGLPEQRHSEELTGYLAIVESDTRRYALAVETLLAPEEIVVKPLSPLLGRSGVFAGAGILAGGELACILDIGAIGQRAGIRLRSEDTSSESSHASPKLHSPPCEDFLIYEIAAQTSAAGWPRRAAIPLRALERIQQITPRSVESTHTGMLLPYNGALLPVEDEGNMLANLTGEQVTVLICRKPHRVAVVVARAVDICTLPSGAGGPHAPFALIDNKVTELRQLGSEEMHPVQEVA